MNFKQFIQDYFTFTRNERKGIIVLVVVIFILAISNKVIFYFETPGQIDKMLFDSLTHDLGVQLDSVSQHKSKSILFSFDPNTIDSLALDSLPLPDKTKLTLLNYRAKGGRFITATDFKKIYGVNDRIYNEIYPFIKIESVSKHVYKENSTPEFFMFDPNKATDSDFKSLGFTERQVRTIRNYISKGGVFRKGEDFFKIYGITEQQKILLTDYIEIKSDLNSEPVSKVVANLKIELNAADSIELKQLPGIGEKLSKRIIKYRDLLGGFNSISQLEEVYGFNVQTIQRLEERVTIDNSLIKKLDLNFGSSYELSKHPYLKKDLATKIVKFRSQNGSFRNLDVLRDSMILNIDEYNRLKPYF